jgi:hypothetical protein
MGAWETRGAGEGIPFLLLPATKRVQKRFFLRSRLVLGALY